MANIRFSWGAPAVQAYSIMQVIYPGMQWTVPQRNPRVARYAVNYKRARDGQWLSAGEVIEPTIEIKNIPDGDYVVRIAIIDILGNYGPWVSSPQASVTRNFIFDFSDPSHIISLVIL